MAAPTKNFTSIADSTIDPDSPLTTTLMTNLRDNDENFNSQLIGETSPFVAAEKHNHDGVNSAIVDSVALFNVTVSFVATGLTNTSLIDVGSALTIPAAQLTRDRTVFVICTGAYEVISGSDQEFRLRVASTNHNIYPSSINGAGGQDNPFSFLALNVIDTISSGGAQTIQLQFSNAGSGNTNLDRVDLSAILIN